MSFHAGRSRRVNSSFLYKLQQVFYIDYGLVFSANL